MVMSIDTQYGMLFKFMNQSRSNYMGLDLTYNFELLPENRISVDIFAEGKFDLPIRTKQMFRNMFMEFFVKDSKYFNIPKSTVGLLDFNNISLNGERLGDRITMDNNFKKDLVDIDGKLKKYYSIDLEDYPQGSFKLESFDNDLKSYIDLIDEDSMMYTVNIDDTKKITLNGNEFNRNTIVDFLDSVDLKIIQLQDQPNNNHLLGRWTPMQYLNPFQIVFGKTRLKEMGHHWDYFGIS